MTKKRNNRWAILAIFSFFISLFCASAWFISNAWFRDQDSMENDVDTAAVQIENNTKYSMSTVVNLALADQYLLDRDITFNITEESSEVYVRCALKFTCTSGAEVAKDMIKFQDYKLGSNIGYSWQQFGEFYYLCDETGIPKTIERSQAGQIFTFVQKDNMLLPRDAIVGKHFTSADQVTMTVEIEAIQGRNLEDSSIYELNQYFLTEIPSDTYTVKFHEADGTILSEQANIAYGANAVVPEITKIKPADHTTFAYWSTTEDGEGLKIREADEARIFSNISQNMEVWPVYAHDQVRIDVTFGEGGTVTPGSTTIDWGTGKTFRVVADSGHAIQQIKRDGVVIYDFSGSKIDMFDYVLENVVADTQIEAIFEPVTYEIIVISVGNGTVNPGTTTAIYGSSKVFTITPDKGYRIWSITLDGVDMPVTATSGNAQRFTISNISSDHVLSVKFVTSLLKITGIAGSNGTIRPSELEVEYDSFASVSVVPNEGYEIASIYIDGQKVDDSKIAKGGVAQNISFEHVREDHVVRATFSKIKLTITSSVSGQGGTISPEGSIEYEYGARASYDITPNPRYTIDKIFVDGAEVAVTVTEGDNQTYVFENIKESHTIVVSFKISYIRLDINGGSGTQPSVSYSLDGKKFTLSNVEPKGPGGKEFYYYSTRALDNERGQLGDRYDLGYEYDIPDLNGTTTLYAIYLEPTQDLSVYSTYMVFPKGTQSVQRIGFDEALKEAGNQEGGLLGQLMAIILSMVLSSSQQDNTLVYCTLPAGLNSLDYYAFSGCKALKGVSVPASLSIINQMAFSNTVSLKSFTVPYSCTSIGSNVFENSSIEEIKMNKKLQSIGSSAFKSSGLKYFKAQSSIISMGKINLQDSNSDQEFASDVFENCASLEEIDFSEQTSFLGQTFKSCTALSKVILPSRLTSIPDEEFRNCSSLSNVAYKNGDTLVYKFPSTLKKIGQFSFYACAFTDLLLDDCSQVSISDYAFAANNFSDLVISSSQIAEVGTYAFSSSSNLKTVDWQIENIVPKYCFAYSGTLQEFKTKLIKEGIADYAFVDCFNLSSVDLKYNGAEFVIATGAFKNCALANDVSIPEGLTRIGAQAFYGNPFKTIVFPETLSDLAEDALQNCLNLEKIQLKSSLSNVISNLNKVGAGPTWYVEGEPYLVGTERSSAPDGIGPAFVYTIYPGAANRVEWEWIEVISDTQIKRYTTSTDSSGNKTTISTVETKTYAGTEIGKKYITKYVPTELASGTLYIVIPTALIDYNGIIHDIEGVVSFETNDIAAEKIANDTVNLEIISGLTYVGDNCFNNSSGKGLASITVPMTIKYVGANAFQGTNLSSVYLPNLEYVGASAFANCSNLTSAEFSNSITQIPDGCFQNSGLTSFVVPQLLTTIGSSAFNSTKITKLYLPATLTEIGTSAFANCANFTSVEGLSNTKITEIKTQTFDKCSNLYRVYLPSTVKTIGRWAFNNCSRLTNLTFGSSLEEIVMYAFFGCTSLSNLEFPETLKSIGTQAFDSCVGITKITFKHTDMSGLNVGENAFNGTTSSLQVYIQSNIQLADFKNKFDGTSTDRGFAEDATLLYQNTTKPLAYYRSKEWKQVCQVVVYCSDAGSATIKFGDEPEQLIQSLKTKIFNVVEGTTYTLLIKPNPNKTFVALTIDGTIVLYNTNKIAGNKTYPTSGEVKIEKDTEIIITFDTPLVILDKNGGSASHIANEDKTKGTFTIEVPEGQNEDDYKNGNGYDFYFYSTVKTDTNGQQIGKRFDVGVTYSIGDLDGKNILYAIYLDPTAASFDIKNGLIYLSDKNVSIKNLVIPKKVNNQVVTGIAACGFSNVSENDPMTSKVSSILSGIITMPSTVTTIGKRAFAGNTEMTGQFSFPYYLTTLNDEVFAFCHFNSININKLDPSSNVVKFANDILYTLDNGKVEIYQFALGSSKTNIDSLDSTIIASYAFAGSSIKSFNDSSYVTTYEAYAFAVCEQLTTVTLQQSVSKVSFENNVFTGTIASLKIRVLNNSANSYISKWSDTSGKDRLGYKNGIFIYEDNNSIPYAQIHEKQWYKIYKVTAKFDAKSADGGTSITITNNSESYTGGTYTNSFKNYTDAFGGGGTYKDYFREDWELEILVVSNSSKGYVLSKLTYKENGGSENNIPLNQKNFNGNTYTHVISKGTRKGDWEITAYFITRNQNISIYLDSGVDQTNLSNLTGPTSATLDGKSYSLYTATPVKYNSKFKLAGIYPNRMYAIITFKFAKTTDENGDPITDSKDWVWEYESVRSTSISSRFNRVGTTLKDKEITGDYVIVVDTVYAPIALKLNSYYVPMGMRYDESTKQYVKIDGVNLVQKNFTSFTIPEVYENELVGSAQLYYFTKNNERFDTGYNYSASLLAEALSSGYYVLEGKYFTAISDKYYDTTRSGVFKLKERTELDGTKTEYAIPKKINGVATKEIATNLFNSGSEQYYTLKNLVLPKTVTSIEFGAFTMSNISEDVYLPTGLTTIAEGGLTISKEGLTTSFAKFYQTRLNSTTYGFAISEDNTYITISNGKTLITANLNIGTTNIPAGITKLGAYLFAGRNDISEYSDEGTSVDTYGTGVFFDCPIQTMTLTKASGSVTFDGRLLNATNKISIYVADDGYMSKLNDVGFWSYSQSQKLDNNPYSSMYVSSNLLAIFRNDMWQDVYYYTYTISNATFVSVSSMQFVDNGKIYIADGKLQYRIENIAESFIVKRIEYRRISNDDLIDSLNNVNVDMTIEYTLTCPTNVVIVVEYLSYEIEVNFNADDFSSEIFEDVYYQSGNSLSDIISSVTLETNNMEVALLPTGDKKKYTGSIIFVPNMVMTFTITLNDLSIFSIINVAEHSGATLVSYNYNCNSNYNFVAQFDQNDAEKIELDATISVSPINLDANYGVSSFGTNNDINSLMNNSALIKQDSSSNYLYYYSISDPNLNLLINGDAECYFFSDDQKSVDLSGNRYDFGLTYKSELDINALTRTTLYARYAKADSGNWSISNGVLTYNSTTTSGVLYSGTTATSTNILVIPKYVSDGTEVTGFRGTTFSDNVSGVKYVVIPNNCKQFGENAFAKFSETTRIQLPANFNIDSVGQLNYVSAFNNLANNTFVSINNYYRSDTYSLANNFISYNGAVYNSTKSIFIYHPAKLEMSSNTMIQDTITKIMPYACQNCEIGTIDLFYTNLNIVGSHAFENCLSVSSFGLAQSSLVAQSIGKYAFNNANINNVFSEKDNAFIGLLGEGAFYNCSSLQGDIYIDSTGIGGSTVADKIFMCDEYTTPSNKSFTIHFDNLTKLGNEVFKNSNVEGITFSDNFASDVSDSEENGYILFDDPEPKVIQFNNLAERIIVPYGESNFVGAKNLQNLEKFSSIRSADSDELSIFYDCINLKYVSFNKTAIFVGDFAFAGKHQLNKIDLCGKKLDKRYVYRGISGGLTKKTLYREMINWDNNGVSFIGEKAFQECGITEIQNAQGLLEIGSYAFSRNSQLTKLDLMTAAEASNLRVIGEHSFEGCVLLSEVSIPSSVQIVKEYAFASCPNLENMTIENMLTQPKHTYLFNGVIWPTYVWSNDVVIGQKNLVYVMPQYKRTVEYEIPVYVRDLDGKWGWNTITITTEHGYFAARSIQFATTLQELNIIGTDSYTYDNVDPQSDDNSTLAAQIRVQNIADTCFKECYGIFYDLRKDSAQRKLFSIDGEDNTEIIVKKLIRISIQCYINYKDGSSDMKMVSVKPIYKGKFGEFIDYGDEEAIGSWELEDS